MPDSAREPMREADLPSLREVAFKAGYDTGAEALHEFYIPALQRAVAYDRSVGFFKSSSLSVAARGLSRFVAHGGRVRLLAGVVISRTDADALRGAREVPSHLAKRLAEALITDDDVDRQRLEVLAWLAQEGRLEVRLAFPVDKDGEPITTVGEDVPYFHEKIGVLRDAHGDGVAFQGSVNESAKGWTQNFESFSVFPSWEDAKHYDLWAEKFEERWNGNVPRFRIYPLPDAVQQALLEYAPEAPPSEREPEEQLPAVGPELLARFLHVAPRLLTAQALAEATVGIEPFPHQSQVSERLAASYPRSWLLADEVGLGKTISAGLALRRLLLSGRVRRALILAPANVARQWQDELFEKLGLWVPRYESGKLHGAHPGDVESVPSGENPYSLERVLIVSSHLARRREQRERILDAAPFDLLIVDEAHHARRRSFADLGEYRPSLLLKLLDELREQGRLTPTWLLTATPMQVHPIELRDLLVQIGLTGPLARWGNFQRFYKELAKDEPEDRDWRWLAQVLRETPTHPPDPAEEAVLARIDEKFGPVVRSRIEGFHDPSRGATETAAKLDSRQRRELVEWIRFRSPTGQLITRHTRETLKRYRDQGLLKERVADRHVDDVPIDFDPFEKRLYNELDTLIDRLMEAHGSRRNAGFVLTVYRRRLTSSWEAIRRTLQRRLAREPGFRLEMDELAEPESEELEDEQGREVDDTEAVPLGDEDLREVERYLDDLERVPDTKLDRLRDDLDDARASGQSVIVFTQFTDTLESLRDALFWAYQDHLATYSGEGGRMWDPDAWHWYAVSKQHLVDAVRTGRCSVILATDAASEGLNLQTCSFLINYDLPWNPMRLEQRIGRIDRIAQVRPEITVLNYTIPGTIEVDVHAALKQRIGQFHDLVGKLQPILGATEEAVRKAYRADRAQREEVVRDEIAELLRRAEELEETGIEFTDEDPYPIPDHPEPPVRLTELNRRVTEELNLQVASADRPVSGDPQYASRDETDWRALLTHGHPRLDAGLEELGRKYDPDRGPVVFAEDGTVVSAFRADRSPPEPVSVARELDDLGEAYTRSEALEGARSTVQAEGERRRQHFERTLRVQEGDWERATRRRFRELMQDVLAARAALRELETAEDADLISLWRELEREAEGLQYAEAFRSRLGLSLDEVLPGRGAISACKERLVPDLKEGARGQGAALVELMEDWRARNASERG